MLAIIAGVLLVLWLLGFTAFHVTSGFIHVHFVSLLPRPSSRLSASMYRRLCQNLFQYTRRLNSVHLWHGQVKDY